MSSVTGSIDWSLIVTTYTPVSCGRKEVDAAVDAAVWYSPLAVDVDLLSQVLLVLLVDVLHYGIPAGKSV